MAVYEIIPNENVLVADIGNTLNANGGSVNINQPSTFFTTDAKINPWSKKKPVYREELFCQDYNSSKPDYVANWWQGKDGKCGFTIPQYTSYTNIPSAMDGGMNGWVYNIPSNPKRLGDFCGYKANATPIVTGFSVTGKVASSEQSSYVTAALAVNVAGVSNELSLTEFPFLKDCYFGIYLKKNSGSVYRRATSDRTIGNSGTEVQIKAYGLDEGNWTAYPFLSMEKITESGSEISSIFYTIPNVSAQSVEVASSSVSIFVDAKYNKFNGAYASITINSIVVSGSSQSLSSNYVLVRPFDRTLNDPLDDKDTRISVGTFSIPTSGSYTIDLGRNSLIAIDNQRYKIWVTLGNGKYSVSTEPADSADIIT